MTVDHPNGPWGAIHTETEAQARAIVALRDQLRKKDERIAALDDELNEGDSWAWIRRKFNADGHCFRWWKPRRDELLGSRYEVMGWLHCLFGDAAYNRVLTDITVEHQKKADEAIARAEKAEAELAALRASLVEGAIR